MALPPRSERPPNPRKRRRWVSLVVLLLLLGGGAWAAKIYLLDSVGPKNILLLGVDEDKTRTDVMLLAHVEPKRGIVNLISLPRDTLVEIPCKGLKTCLSPDKLNHAHAYGGDNGPDVAVKTVQNWLDLKIDGYVRVDYDGFEKIVDQLGGVDIVIEKNMNYYDPAANPPLKIDFKAGSKPQHLNGDLALKYVRYRNDGLGDLGRIERTKKFVSALLSTLRQSGKITKLPGMVTAIWPYVSTNLGTATAVGLARMAPDFKVEQLHAETIPGTDKVLKDGRWVWIPDEKATRELVDKLVLHPVSTDN